MIFQEPLTSLNPVFTVGDQIAEQVKLHKKVSDRESKDQAVEMLRLVGIPTPERRCQAVPPRALRRHAPARHDRDGAVVRSASC